MQKYLVFAGSAYYPGGGWTDFVGQYETLEEARQARLEYPGECDWWHIVFNFKIVEEG